MPYQFHEDVSVADVAFSATAATLEELLVEAAKATFEVMVNLRDVSPREKREIRLAAETPEKLLFAWLEELIYLKDADSMVFSDFQVKVREEKNSLSLEAVAAGEPIDQKRHALNVDVKAVTYHRFEVKQSRKGWEAFVILDI